MIIIATLLTTALVIALAVQAENRPAPPPPAPPPLPQSFEEFKMSPIPMILMDAGINRDRHFLNRAAAMARLRGDERHTIRLQRTEGA